MTSDDDMMFELSRGAVPVRRTWKIAGWRVRFEYVSGSEWGRFGGGWNWALGFRAGGSTLECYMLVFSIRLDRECQESSSDF
jgi:hypothetical protein